MRCGDSFSKLSGKAVEFRETTASTPIDKREGVQCGHGFSLSPPSYREVTIREGANSANVVPPTYAGHENQNIMVDDLKEDPLLQNKLGRAGTVPDATYVAGDPINYEEETPREVHKDAYRRSPPLLMLILTLLLLMTINRTGTIVGGILLGFVYLIEMFFSNSFSYLRGSHEKETVKIIVNNMIAAAPSIKWHVKCYHEVDN